MKNQTHHFQLIDATYTADQARQVLGAMVKSKIDYHSLEKHREGERSGLPNHSKKRFQSIRTLDADFNALFESARTSGAKLKVAGNIEIALIE